MQATISRPAKVMVPLAAALALVFWLAAALPYLTVDREAFGPDPERFWDRRHPLWLHILGGTVALFLGPAQIWLGETRQRLAVHRALGWGYVGGAGLTCAASVWLALTKPLSLTFNSGLLGMSLAGAGATSMAVVAIQRRSLLQHREWMIRSYVVILAFVFFRLMEGMLDVLQVGVAGEAAWVDRLGAAAWASWALPLLVTEVALQWRRTVRG